MYCITFCQFVHTHFAWRKYCQNVWIGCAMRYNAERRLRQYLKALDTSHKREFYSTKLTFRSLVWVNDQYEIRILITDYGK